MMIAAAMVLDEESGGLRASVTVLLVVGCQVKVVAIPMRTRELRSGMRKGLAPVGTGMADVHAVDCGTEVMACTVLKV